MREIKFRAWNAYAKTMYEVDVLHIRNRTWEMPQFNQKGMDAQYMSLVYQPNVVLMQYTGLKDKNGQEIFEGDIVRGDGFWNQLIHEVEWFDGSFRLGSNHLSAKNAQHQEVIGNIYENPELLKVEDVEK